jgi:hypothetical protein
MADFQLIIVLGLAAGLGLLLFRKARSAQRSSLASPEIMFGGVLPLLSDAVIEPGPTAGSAKLTGHYRGQVFQIQTIVDVLVTRKLPSLWLMVTLPRPQPVEAVFDLMMRSAGPSTFSNFDFLEHVIERPGNFPEHAMIRTDDPSKIPAPQKVLPHLALFFGRQGKELLISPKGLRIVVQAAQADRARYGVLREANFGKVVIDAELTLRCLNTLLDLQSSLRDRHA